MFPDVRWRSPVIERSWAQGSPHEGWSSPPSFARGRVRMSRTLTRAAPGYGVVSRAQRISSSKSRSALADHRGLIVPRVQAAEPERAAPLRARRPAPAGGPPGRADVDEHHADRQARRGLRQRQRDRRIAGGVLQRRERHPVDQSVHDLVVVGASGRGGRSRGVTSASVGISTDVVCSPQPRGDPARRATACDRQRKLVQVAARPCGRGPSVRLSSRVRSKLGPNMRRPPRTTANARNDQ